MKQKVKEYCAKCCTVENVKNKFPITNWLPKYRFYDFQSDMIAGLTVALTVVPQGLAYANIADLPPQYGLYSAFVGVFVYCFLGTAKDITLGPTAIISLLTATFASAKSPDSLDDPDSKDPTYAVILCLVCGVVQLLMGVLRLGIIVNLISYPVINAFTSAAAITIAVGQLKGILGLKHIPREFIHQVYELCKHVPDTKVWDLTMGVTSFILVTLLKKLRNIKWKEEPAGRRPTITKMVIRKAVWLTGISANAIIVISAAIIASILLENGIDKLTITGHVTPGLPPIRLPDFSIDRPGTNGSQPIHKGFGDILSDIGPGLAIVPLLALVETIAIGKAFARQNNYKIIPNQELIAIGIANIASCFVSSYPVTGSFSRTAVNSQSGVRTPASGLFTGAVVLIALRFLTPFCKYIPKSALSAVIISACISTIDYRIVPKVWRVQKVGLIPMFVTFITSFVVGIEYGILIGIGISLLILLYPIARPKLTVDYSDTVVVSLDQGMKFPSLEYVQAKITKEMKNGDASKNVILDCTHISGLDFTAVQGIIELEADFIRHNAIFALACAKPDVITMLENAGIQNLIQGATVSETMRMIEKSKETELKETSLPEMNGTVTGIRNGSVTVEIINEYDNDGYVERL